MVNISKAATGRVIRRLREKLRLTRSEFSDLIGISTDALSSFERGEKWPDIGVICSIANACDASVDAMIKDIECETKGGSIL
jgi:transcriptional regulator with XRE-family HTH domain